MSSSALHQPNSSPYTTNKFHHTCFSELPGLANPAYPISLWDPILDTSQHGEDFVVPDTSNAFSFSDNSQFVAGLQLPAVLPVECNYLSGCGLDEPGLASSVHFMNVPENGPTSDVMMVQDYGTSNFATSTYDQLGKTSWEIQSQRNQQASSTPNTRVGRYSVEERRDRILRYLKKRNQRNFNKTIKYACRKTLADRRIRVRGRFAKNNEEGVDMMKCTRNDDTSSSYHDYADQRKQDGEAEWLQEAISSLMYNMAPYNYNHVPQWQPTGLPLQ